MGGGNWLTQIRGSFPILGQFRNAGVYPDVKDLPDKFVTKEKLRDNAQERWAELGVIVRHDSDTKLIWEIFQEEVKRKMAVYVNSNHRNSL